MEGKTCVVTGANSGLGLATCKALAGKGAKVLMICRNAERGERAREEVAAMALGPAPDLLLADLSSQAQIRRVARTIREGQDSLDVLVNNAGVWYSEFTRTEDGIETVFAVNHLAYVLLTHCLYPALRRGGEARIVNLSSDNHYQATMHFEDLSLEKRYHGLRSYAQSKLGNVLFTKALHRRKPDHHVWVNAVQPGLVHTDIGLKHTTLLHSLAWKFRRTFFPSQSPDEGAQTTVHLAASPEVAGESGKYWEHCTPKPASEEARDEAVADRLWEVSLALCGIDDFFAPAGQGP